MKQILTILRELDASDEEGDRLLQPGESYEVVEVVHDERGSAIIVTDEKTNITITSGSHGFDFVVEEVS